MNKKIKKLWVKALRSGKFQQAEGALKKGKKLKPTDLIKFDWEKKVIPPLTKDEVKRLDNFKNKVEKVKEWKPIKKM